MKYIYIIAIVFAGTRIVSAQSKVTTGGQKYFLLEEATGSWCPWCPDGAQVVEETILPYGAAANFPNVIFASFHVGASDKMTLPGDPFIGANFGSGTPHGNLDRIPAYGTPAVVAMNRALWKPELDFRYGIGANFDVSMVCLYDTATRIISINLKAKAIVAMTGSFRLNAYITEDSVACALYGYRQNVDVSLTASGALSSAGTPSWYEGKTSPMTSPTEYSHMAVVRKILATSAGGGIWGDSVFTGSVAIGDSFEKTYYDTLPLMYESVACNPYMTNVIGMVQQYGATKLERPIENAIQAKVRYMSKTLEVPAVARVQELQIAPNPASDRLIVRAILEKPGDMKISIINTAGQQVLARAYKAGGSIFAQSILINELPDGLYFINAVTEGGTVTKQFVVKR